jgi:hypothetical protein
MGPTRARAQTGALNEVFAVPMQTSGSPTDAEDWEGCIGTHVG